MEKSTIILSAETQFAREVTLGVIYLLPLPMWCSLIPGMFLFDFIRRNRAIGNFTKCYMFPRKLAIDAEESIANGKNRSAINESIQTGIEEWLKSQNLLTKDLMIAQKKVIDVLADHYKKLLKAKGALYNDLIENAYKTRKTFHAHLTKLEKAENNIDHVLMHHANRNDKFKERLKIEAQQIKLRRKRMVDDIF